MTPPEFLTWFRDFVKISETPPSSHEWALIKAKLATVFNKVTTKTVAPQATPKLEPTGGYKLFDFGGNAEPVKSAITAPTQWPELKLYSVEHTC